MFFDAVMLGVFAILGIGVLLPAYWGWSMIVYFYRHTRVTPAIAEPCPRVAVILCLRGADPSLDACLAGLLHQEYPCFQLHIVVDNRTDRAWSKIEEILARGTPATVQVHVNVLEKPCATCSLKVCAQLQIVDRLGPEIDIVALIDADSIPAPDWLRALVLPFADPTIGAASGMRWYAPLDCGWGSLIRHIFNVGSYSQMYAFQHAWGGSFAIRTDVFRRSSLKARWCKALCEDSAITGPLRELGLRLVFVPAATNLNAESINFEAARRFIQRQLVCVRLDHVDWPSLLRANMFNSFSLATVTLLSGLGALVGRWDWFCLGSGLLATFAVAMYAGMTVGEFVVRRNYWLRGLTPAPIVWTWRLVPAFFYTQYLCMKLMWQARGLRQVAWRGVNYTIQGPGDIRLDKYVPYEPAKEVESPRHSAI